MVADRIVLHHHQQNPNGFIVEMPAGNHNIWNTRQHPFGNTPGAGLTAEQRAAFNEWRVDYVTVLQYRPLVADVRRLAASKTNSSLGHVYRTIGGLFPR